MDDKVQILSSTETIQAINQSEVDVAISTAKKYPRDLQKSLSDFAVVATVDKETASECFFSLPRGGSIIEGYSIRMAEILVSCYGNISVGSRILGHDGKKVTASAVCHDLEKNVRYQTEVDRKILTKTGNTFGDDMIIMTGNAAGKIALRNAIFTVIPKAFIAPFVKQIKAKALSATGEDPRKVYDKMLKFLKKEGFDEKAVFKALDVEGFEEIDEDKMLTLRGLCNAMRGGVDVSSAFGKTISKTTSDKIKESAPKDGSKDKVGEIKGDESSFKKGDKK